MSAAGSFQPLGGSWGQGGRAGSALCLQAGLLGNTGQCRLPVHCHPEPHTRVQLAVCVESRGHVPRHHTLGHAVAHTCLGLAAGLTDTQAGSHTADSVSTCPLCSDWSPPPCPRPMTSSSVGGHSHANCCHCPQAIWRLEEGASQGKWDFSSCSHGTGSPLLPRGPQS